MSVIKLIAILGLIMGALIIFVRLLEEKSIYFPMRYPAGNWQPSHMGVSVEECYLTTEDGFKIHGWYIAGTDSMKVMLWLHGNAGNITHRLDNLQMLQPHSFSIFIIDYRGYGKSEGEPSENGLYLDAEAAFDYLIKVKHFLPEQIVLFGRSLGGAVAAELARRRSCAGIILESTFTSVADMARLVLPILPTTRILKTRFATITKLPQIRRSLLIIHGKRDDLIPFSHGQKLFAAANEPKYFYAIPAAGHNDLYYVGGMAYFNRLKQFIVSGH